MKEPEVIKENEILSLLKSVIEMRESAVMSHLSKSKWHMTKITFVDLCGDALHIEVAPKENPHPVNIQIDQPVGISFKHAYSKLVFESVVLGFEPSVNGSCGGRILLSLPDHIERLQRRNYFRVNVPENMAVKVLFWHRGYNTETNEAPRENYWQGKLIDLSAGGLQVGIDTAQGPNFKTGQLVGLQFTPLPYDKPLLLEAQVRHIAKTADGGSVCLGLQLLGLEASIEGREKLRQICKIVQQYHQMSQTPDWQNAAKS
jgi:c-di-GMP-binding flagellar brake protein YcgR